MKSALHAFFKSPLLAVLISPALLQASALAKPVKYADSLMLESSAFANNREIMVSLPDSYGKSSNTLYPVIYVVRGQLDLLSVVAAVNMLDLEAPEMIMVGINGSGAEFFPSEKKQGSQFSQLLHDEVVPHIEQNYRVAPYRILVGHSAAGKFVTNDWLERGNDFQAYYVISPELHDGRINEQAKSLSQKVISSKGTLLVSMGDEDPRMQSMFDELKTLYAKNERIAFIQHKGQTHMSGRVHTTMAGLRQSFAGWRPARDVESGRFEDLQAHYESLSKQYGYQVNIPLETMKRLSAFDSASDDEKRWQNAADVVKYALTKTPSDINEFIDTSDEMKAYGMSDGSKRLVTLICSQAIEHARCAQ